MYNKLFTKILDSSIWLESAPTRLVWLTFIAVMDEHGFVQFAAPANVAHRARVTLEEAEEALHTLESPDPNSSNPNNDGRRIERVPGGWMVLNAKDHRDMVTRAIQKEQTKTRVQRFREKKRNGNAPVTPSEAVADASSKAEKAYGDQFEVIWSAYPKRAGGNSKAAAHKAYKARLREGEEYNALLDGTIRYAHYCRETDAVGGRYVKQAATFFGPDKHYLEPWTPPPKPKSKTERGRAAIQEYIDRPADQKGDFDGF